MSKKIKIFVIIVLGLAALIFAAKYFGGNKTPKSTNALSSSNPIGGAVPSSSNQPLSGSNEFTAALSSIKTIDIDTSIFSNQAYRTLRDYPVVLGTDIVGRSNPFAPIGSDPQGGAIAPKSQIQTIQPAKITTTTAEFGAQVTLEAATTGSVVFEFGLTELFGSSTNPVAVTKNGVVLSRASGLLPATNYYVRAILIQGADTFTGNTMTFNTN